MARISLFFEEFLDEILENKLPSKGRAIRLYARIKFQMPNGFTHPFQALVDTGAHTSIIPSKIWSLSDHKILTTHSVKGLVPKPECKIDVKVGEISAILLDKYAQTNPYKLLAYFAPNDEVPLIIGFKDLMSKFRVCFDYSRKEAFLEEL